MNMGDERDSWLNAEGSKLLPYCLGDVDSD